MQGLEKVIDGIAKKAEIANRAVEGDYIGDDGLLYCHKCNTKKQTKVSLFFGDRVVSCLCKCKADEIEREEEHRKQIAFNEKIKEYRKIGFPESDMQNWTFENADGSNEKIMRAMQNYVKHFEEMRERGKGLLLFGTVGTGKTYAAACVANALIDKGYPVMMTNFARIANTISGLFEGKQEYIDSFNKFPLLIIDDLSAERKTEYMQEIVFQVIDARYRAGLPLIITTNLSAEELKHPSEITYQRTFSRLLEMCVPIKVEGKDKRHEKLKEDYTYMNDLLGL